MRRLLGVAWALGLLGCGGDLGGRDASPERDASADAGGATHVDAGRPRADGGATDASAVPEDARVADPDAGPPPPSGPVLYPVGGRHSPLPEAIAEGLRAVAARDATLEGGRLMKVGDSITVSTAFLHCFEGANVELDGRPLDATVARFAGWWDRTSEAATVGWSASAPLAGDPSPLDREHAATRARFAVVMFGTNDVGYRDPQDFARDLWEIADVLLARGTIPLMSTIPPRDDDASANANVPVYNLAIRAIAQGRGVPLVDLHRELVALPGHGLAGDGVHLQVYGAGGCRLSADGLAYGSNVRNLLTLEQLERAARAIDGAAPDAAATRLVGAGTADDPHVVAELPFAAMGDTRGGDRGVDVYACATANEGGPSRVYAFTLPAPARVRATALSDRGVDVDVHVLSGAVRADACLARDDRVVSADLGAGTHYVVVDTYVDGTGAELAGEYLVTIDAL